MNEVVELIAGGTLIGALIQLFDNWQKKRRIDVNEGELALPRRHICWGTIRAANRNPFFDRSYFFIRLPSYGMHYSIFSDEDQWSQLVLMWTPRRNGWGGWRRQYWKVI